tara:strand:+ start:3561 stop:3740 length:180 start_codon:yes stop_codon:yes gene_type:complete
MGKVNDYQQDFLETTGRQLGYDEDNMPEFSDIETVITFKIPVWDYLGKSKESYYGKGGT